MRHHGKHSNVAVCPTTQKVGFSESQANRRLGKYEDIVRYYHCDPENGGCGLYHLTSTTTSEIIGRHVLPPEEENKLLKEQIQQLKEKVTEIRIKNNRQRKELTNLQQRLTQRNLEIQTFVNYLV